MTTTNITIKKRTPDTIEELITILIQSTISNDLCCQINTSEKNNNILKFDIKLYPSKEQVEKDVHYGRQIIGPSSKLSNDDISTTKQALVECIKNIPKKNNQTKKILSSCLYNIKKGQNIQKWNWLFEFMIKNYFLTTNTNNNCNVVVNVSYSDDKPEDPESETELLKV